MQALIVQGDALAIGALCCQWLAGLDISNAAIDTFIRDNFPAILARVIRRPVMGPPGPG